MRRSNRSLAALSFAFVPALLTGATMLGLSSCDGAAEDAGEEIDRAIDDAGDAVEDVGDSIEDAADDVTDGK